MRGRPNIIGIDKGLGHLEARICRAIAELPLPVNAAQVCDALSRSGYFAYQGVLNSMNRLVRKGILSRTQEGKIYYYRPLIELEELSSQVVTNVLSHMGGNLDRVICRVLKINPDIGAAKIAQLRKRIGEAKS